MSETWFTADNHFGHANIIRYEERPFADVDAMNTAMIESWNTFVQNGDIVWILGDFCLGPITLLREVVRQLNGRKYLVVGNHDRPFTTDREKRAHWTSEYIKAGFDLILHGSVDYRLNCHYPVLLSHFPYQGDSRKDVERFVDHRPDDTGLPLLHGHVHGRWSLNGRQLNVGVDVEDFCPVSERALITRFQRAHLI